VSCHRREESREVAAATDEPSVDWARLAQGTRVELNEALEHPIDVPEVDLAEASFWDTG
jgi:hypothetical protein